MIARYYKFLNSKPKVFGIEILDVYLVFFSWVIFSIVNAPDVLRLIAPLIVGISIIYYKKSFRPLFIHFFLRKRKYTKITVGVRDEK